MKIFINNLFYTGHIEMIRTTLISKAQLSNSKNKRCAESKVY